MIASNEKISTRQAAILFFMTTLSPAIRLFPQYTANVAGKAGWLSPVVALIPTILLIYIVNSFFKKYKDANLSDVYFKILGNILGRIVISLYLIWILIMLSLYVRYYAERILSSILPNTSISFLIIAMLFIVFLAARSGLVTIARANEIFFGIFVLIFFITFILGISQIHIRNILLVSYRDAWPVIKASNVILAIWGYFLFIFFFGDKINDKEHIKKFSFQAVLLKYASVTLFLIMTIGTLGSALSSRMSLPFFVVVKNISVLGTVERLESVLLALWVISDFVIITVFTYISISLIKSIFKLTGTKSLVSPVLLIAGIGSLYLAKNRFEIETFSTHITQPVNILFEFIIPFIVFGIGKIRKKI